jgi:hypothetical protein
MIIMISLQVNQVDLGFFILFLIEYFFQFHSSKLSWLGIEIYNYFLCVFYRVILAFWLEYDRLTQVDLGHFYPFFFNLIIQH